MKTGAPWGHPLVRICLALSLGLSAVPLSGLSLLLQPVLVQGLPWMSMHDKKEQIFREWSTLYGLDQPYPPPTVGASPAFNASTGELSAAEHSGWAPHLEECIESERRRQREEQYDEEGGYPSWTCTVDSGDGVQKCERPLPPWVQGSDTDNLNWTRIVQRDIWLHQFPRNCSDPRHRFFVASWVPRLSAPGRSGFGLGYQIHIMSMSMALAMQTGRILVLEPGSFMFANHSGCEGVDRHGTWECYFFPITPRECTERAMELVAQGNVFDVEEVESTTQSAVTHSAVWWKAKGPIPVVRLPRNDTRYVYRSGGTMQAWGSPWASGFPSFSLYGLTVPTPNIHKTTWWRSQTTRFFTRWPTAYLCHVTNKVRHELFGDYMAAGSAAAVTAMQRLMLEEPSIRKNTAAKVSFCERMGVSVPFDALESQRYRPQPQLPSPIVSLFIRRGDKYKEMEFVDMRHFKLLLEYVKLLWPSVRHVFLSTEAHSVMADFEEHSRWKLFSSPVPWPDGLSTSQEYIDAVGLETYTNTLLTNLIICSQCDFFVGSLSSNWDRLINELRMTSGKLLHAYVTMNLHED